MPHIPIPDIFADSIFYITPRFLQEHSIVYLLIDLDNTLAPYGMATPTHELQYWVETMKKAGVELYIVSNNRGKRPALYAEILGIGHVRAARKPGTAKLVELLKQKGIVKEKAALVGDQIYADVLCAHRVGIKSILVRPISMKNPLVALRYWLEAPFRSIGRKKYMEARKSEQS